MLRRLLTRWSRVRRECPHPDHRVQCIHGDAIIQAGYHRGWCYECFRLVWDLPATCKVSGRPHFPYDGIDWT